MLPEWLVRILMSLGWPALKAVLKIVLRALEVKYPGLTPLIEAILKFLDGGGSAEVLQQHCESLPGFCPKTFNDK